MTDFKCENMFKKNHPGKYKHKYITFTLIFMSSVIMNQIPMGHIAHLRKTIQLGLDSGRHQAYHRLLSISNTKTVIQTPWCPLSHITFLDHVSKIQNFLCTVKLANKKSLSNGF